jgi:hypothetical protein
LTRAVERRLTTRVNHADGHLFIKIITELIVYRSHHRTAPFTGEFAPGHVTNTTDL